MVWIQRNPIDRGLEATLITEMLLLIQNTAHWMKKLPSPSDAQEKCAQLINFILLVYQKIKENIKKDNYAIEILDNAWL